MWIAPPSNDRHTGGAGPSSAPAIRAPIPAVSPYPQLRSPFSGLFFNLITKRYDRDHETLL
jgi:hypothetical protein